jgi:cellulose synthase/poly-beta-1,6-N-acetylglucosamine synthase-like glycosyltransferase
MSSAWWIALLVFGINFSLWGAIALLRIVDAFLDRFRSTVRSVGSAKHLQARQLSAGGTDHDDRGLALGLSLPDDSPFAFGRRVELHEVAVLMAAHNEEVVIEDSLTALTTLVDPRNVFVVSDFSTDRTVELARAMQVNVTQTPTNVGKAGALEEGIRAFGLLERFQAVLLLDADTRLDHRYFAESLPLFDDPHVVAVAGCAHSHWRGAGDGWWARAITAHRSRVYALTQRLIKYGQTWRLTNVTHIVPGFASMYRTRALQHITINPPGLVIEDFNMTFEVYRKLLGRVGFNTRAVAVTQDPDNFHDYVKQTKRWALGLWQTVRKHRLRPDLLSMSMTLLLGELVTASLMLLALPVVIPLLGLPLALPALVDVPGVGDAYAFLSAHLSLGTIAVGVLVPDYLLSCFVAVVERRPRYLLFAPFFIFFRIVDAGIALYTIPRAWQERSTGRWVSPARRDPDAAVVRAPAGTKAAHEAQSAHEAQAAHDVSDLAIDLRSGGVSSSLRDDDTIPIPLPRVMESRRGS